MHLVEILALGLLFMAADRLAGGDFVSTWRAALAARISATRWPPAVRQALQWMIGARAVAWSTVALAIGLALLGLATPFGPRLAVLALGFAGWRWDGWGTFGGGIDPQTQAQLRGLFERHLFAVPAFVLAGLATFGLQLHAVLAMSAAMTVFAAYATAIGALLAVTEGPGLDMNAIAEPARGFGLGVLLGLALRLVA